MKDVSRGISFCALVVAGAGALGAACSSSDGTGDNGSDASATGGAANGGSTNGGGGNAGTSPGGSGNGGSGNAGTGAGGESSGSGGLGGGAAGGSVDGGAGTGGSTNGGASNGGASNGGSGTGGGTATGDPTGVQAASANDFLSSIGVCTHVGQGVDAPAASATAIAYAGIRNLRDDGRSSHIQDWISMHQSSGVRVCLLTDHDVTSTLDMAKQLNAAGALLAVEGANEPNNFPVTYQSQTSDYNTTFVPVANLQKDLYAAVKAEPTLKGIPVFHSSEAGGSEPDNVGLQFLTIPNGAGIAMPDGTKYADYANVHNYVCGHSNNLVDNVAWKASDPTLNGDWDGMYVEYGHTWHGGFDGYSNADLVTLPKVTTETGWLTTGNGAITEEQQGRVFLNLYLSAYKQGFSYTFIYMLRDDPGQGYWGLFDTSYTAKKSGLYLHNLTTVLADTASAPAGKLDYSIASEPATVHDLLLQKSNGTFELVVWDERFSGGSDSVTVNLGKSRATVKVYDPTTGTAPTRTLTDAAAVDLSLGDHPVVIEI